MPPSIERNVLRQTSEIKLMLKDFKFQTQAIPKVPVYLSGMRFRGNYVAEKEGE